MKKKILVISGGISKERLISLDTGKQVANELIKNNYIVKISEPDHNLTKTVKSFKPNIIFNALHGQFGEDGFIQTILESTQIPYTHSGVISSFNSMNKLKCWWKKWNKRMPRNINNKSDREQMIQTKNTYCFFRPCSITKMFWAPTAKIKLKPVKKPNKRNSIKVY